MRSVTFQNVLYGTARILGLDPYRDLNLARAGTLTEYVNNRLLEGWKFDYWPEWTLIERRAYRDNYLASENITAGTERFYVAAQLYYQALRAQTPAAQTPATWNGTAWIENAAWWAASAATYSASDWATGTAYTVGNQVRNLDDGLFYQCHTAHTAGATFDATRFGVLTPFSRYVAYEQTGRTALDEVKRVCRKDPRLFSGSPGEVGFFPTSDGIQVTCDAPAQVWLEFRQRVPVFDATPWSATVPVAAGTVRYIPLTGNCYLALQAGTNQNPVTQTAYWKIIPFPLVLASFVKRAAAADALVDQKQTDRSAALLHGTPGTDDRGAYGELSDAHDREFAGQGQFSRAEVVGYGSYPVEQRR